jgi:hydroxymethylglutaryl-CoA lyase
MSLRLVEVGPRDGLQNEKTPIATELKVGFVEALLGAGLREIEATSFVSPKWVPQLGDAAELWPLLPDGLFSALVPNRRGLERALELGVKRIAVFTASSEAFTQKNINMTVEESLVVFRELVAVFRDAVPDGWVRGYVSTAFECPFAGRMDPRVTAAVAARLHDMGVDEVSLGDTIGVAVPSEVRALTAVMRDHMPLQRVGYHFHDTRGTAVANVFAAWEDGIRLFDASAGGLGGCPYAPGAGGNLATEDLIYSLERAGVPTGVDLLKLSRASLPILSALARPPQSKAQIACLATSLPQTTPP